MSKFKVGEIVQIKNKYPMTGLIGVILKCYKENHTYLVRFSHDHKIFLHEDDIEVREM
ncbi:hypothetical protein [Enterococcus sp. AZ128]|uniref:hypothetical protein n=1 Tax=unclassified Enterococcus TaxID=2608891 RepID=UPI003F686565